MKNHLSPTKHRLTDAEKTALWHRIAPAVSPSRRRRFEWRPVFAGSAVAAASLLFVFWVFQGDPVRLDPLRPEVYTKKADPDKVRVLQSEGPAAPGNKPAVTPPATGRRAPSYPDETDRAGSLAPTVADGFEKPLGTPGDSDLEVSASGARPIRSKEGVGSSEEVLEFDPGEKSRGHQLASKAAEVPVSSYQEARYRLERDEVPSQDAVRVADFVNNFNQGYSQVDEEPLQVFADGIPSPAGGKSHLLRVGIQAAGTRPALSPRALARDVRVEVDFDPSNVATARLLGDEARAESGVQNAIETGVILAGQQAITALYEILLTDRGQQSVDEAGRRPGGSVHLATVNLQYETVASAGRRGSTRQIGREVTGEDLQASFEGAPARLRLAAVAAEFAAILQAGSEVDPERIQRLVAEVDRLTGELNTDPEVIELGHLVRKTAELLQRGE